MDEKTDQLKVCPPWRSRQRHRQKKRVQYRIMCFLCLVGGAILTGGLSGFQHNLIKLDQGNEQFKSSDHNFDIIHASRRLEAAVESPCISSNRVNNKYMLIIYGAGVLYTFVAIAIVCDEFFVPALEEIASEDYLDLSMDVAGATLMAAGGSAPELFTSLIGTFQGSEVGFGTIVGSAVFNVLFVIGMCAIFSKDILTLTWWPLARDCVYYVVGLALLTVFCGYISPGKIEIWEALVQFGLYIGYVVLMKYNERLWSIIQNYIQGNKVTHEKEKAKKDYSLGSGKAHTFRAGLLNLFMGKGSLLDRVGIAMVTKITGDVDTVFSKLDASGDGFIDNTEFRTLVESLGTVVDDDEIDQAINDLDDNKDGKVNEIKCKWNSCTISLL